MPEPSPPNKRRGRLLRSGAALVVLFAVAGYLAVQYAAHGPVGPGCRVVSDRQDGRAYEFTPEQAVNAATISAVGTSRGLPERAVTIALATAIQESSLRNIRYGDRDSLGLFQQRPSQGWGTAAQIMDPTYAADQFYTHLVKVPGYMELPLTQAAQRVQRSGFPDAYAKHETDAELLAAAFTGHAAATLTCQGRPAPSTAGGPDAVRAALARDFGRTVLQQAGAEVTPDRGKADAGTRAAGGTPLSVSPGPADTAGQGTADGPRATLASASSRSTPQPRSGSKDPALGVTLGAPTSWPADGGTGADPVSETGSGTEAAGGADTQGGTDAGPSGESSGDSAKSRTVTLPVPETGGEGAATHTVGSSERGWQLAHWAVANASELHIERVTFAGREWRAGLGATRDGWRPVSGKDGGGTGGPQSSQGAVRIITTPR